MKEKPYFEQLSVRTKKAFSVDEQLPKSARTVNAPASYVLPGFESVQCVTPARKVWEHVHVSPCPNHYIVGVHSKSISLNVKNNS